jgi:hypothetical protein
MCKISGLKAEILSKNTDILTNVRGLEIVTQQLVATINTKKTSTNGASGGIEKY